SYLKYYTVILNKFKVIQSIASETTSVCDSIASIILSLKINRATNCKKSLRSRGHQRPLNGDLNQ
ncbi:MAG: hypothetical protein SH818_03975, partial [Saprospiraceae bacterium]|nr:hypothetical protein [Saprospiraceae bacterium]